MNDYEERVTGVLNRGFQGHIRYMLQLPENVRWSGEKMPIYSRKIHIFLLE